VTAVVGDYDFRLGKVTSEERVAGLGGLGFVMTPRAATIGVFAIAASPRCLAPSVLQQILH